MCNILHLSIGNYGIILFYSHTGLVWQGLARLLVSWPGPHQIHWPQPYEGWAKLANSPKVWPNPAYGVAWVTLGYPKLTCARAHQTPTPHLADRSFAGMGLGFHSHLW